MTSDPLQFPITRGIETIRDRWPEVVSSNDEEPVFVLAAGWRSGSTLLQRLMLPHCFIWGEPYGRSGIIESMADSVGAIIERWPEDRYIFQGESLESLGERFIANLYPTIQQLLEAHHRFFETLLIEPARNAGAQRWGFKEIRLGADHAAYLKWLYPRAKFLFLYRNPFDGYRSYLARRQAGWDWYKRYPDQPVTAHTFGRHWREMVESFLAGHQAVDGLVVRYEDLARREFEAIEDYVGFQTCRAAAASNPPDGGPASLESIPHDDLIVLTSEVKDLAGDLGYAYETPTRGYNH
jgi:hypothetical protein